MTTIVPSEFDGVTWLEPWALVEENDRRPLEHELRRELAANVRHVLFGRPTRAIGRRSDRDDVLYLVENPRQFAVVHLTYVCETRPEYPRTTVFETFSEFVEARMTPDRDEFADGDE